MCQKAPVLSTNILRVQYEYLGPLIQYIKSRNLDTDNTFFLKISTKMGKNGFYFQNMYVCKTSTFPRRRAWTQHSRSSVLKPINYSGSMNSTNVVVETKKFRKFQQQIMVITFALVTDVYSFAMLRKQIYLDPILTLYCKKYKITKN